MRGEWWNSCDQFIKDSAEAEEVCAGIYPSGTAGCLFRRHVLRRAHDLRFQRHRSTEAAGRSGGAGINSLGNAEVDDLGDRPIVHARYQNVPGLEITMDDPLLVRMLYGQARLFDQLQPL